MTTSHKKSTTKSAKKSKKKPTKALDHITVNGQTYEKVSSESVLVELDLTTDVWDHIDRLIKDGKYVSKSDAIRDILRQYMRERGHKA